MNKSWIFIIIAGFVEILWATGLKYSDNLLEWGGTALLIYFSFALLVKATRSLPVATVYAIFTGMGTAGTAVVGIVVFGEAFSWVKVFFILLLLSGVVGLKLVTNESSEKEGAV